MTKKLKKIVEAETTPIQEEQVEQGTANFLDNVGEAVLVGRLKDGTEFVMPINMNDALKMKAYCAYGTSYFDMVIDKSIFAKMQIAQAQAEAAAKSQETGE